MHILFVWSYWQYPELGFEFLDRIKQLGHKISVYLAIYEGDGKAFADRGIDIYVDNKIDYFSKILNNSYPILRNSMKILRDINPDVVHINSHLFFSNFQVAHAAYRLRIPIVITVHGVRVKRNFIMDKIQSAYLRVIGKSLLKMASKIICLTNNDAITISRIASCIDKITIIPNGVDTDLFKPDNRCNGLIVWVGRFVPEKGLSYLLKAMPKVIHDVPNSHLLLVGDGVCKSELKQITTQLNITDHIEFLGTVNREKVASILSKAMIFAFPSLQEGLPFSILEAMACGVPVVGSNIPGIASIVDHNVTGLLFPPKDVERLAKDIVVLLKNSELNQQMGIYSRSKVLKKYTWKKNSEALNGIYLSLQRNY